MIAHPFDLEIDYRGHQLRVTGTIEAGRPERRWGHPDTWHEGEGPEIDAATITLVRGARERALRGALLKSLWNDADLSEKIEAAAECAATCPGEA